MSRSNSIVKQASILALAGILVRIIGLLYRSPLTAMILDEGNGYYSTAYNIYALVLLISSYSIPTAISKLISEKIALKEYKNVTYTTLLISGKLNSYLVDINEQAQERLETLIEQMKQAQGVTEQLKAENAFEWIGRMNNIRACAVEIVNTEIIYA